MKVTISFNGTKIVVPCGDGDISVRELTSLAATRYKKAIGKPNHYWVSVASLKSHEGGILDPDDLICDVCDDREQLAALFDEQNGGGHHHGGGDGMSSSDSDTKEHLSTASSSSGMENLLQVRRGSEPVLNKPVCETASTSVGGGIVTTSSGSVQAVIASINARSTTSGGGGVSNNVGRSLSTHGLVRHASGDHLDPTSYFGGQQQHQQQYNQQQHLRSSLRMTMVNRNSVFEVLDGGEHHHQHSPDSQSFEDSGSLNVLRRREPLGASGNKPERPKSPCNNYTRPIVEDEVTCEIVIPNEIGPLGIHVVPCDTDGRLVVQGIEPGGRVDRDGRLAVGDGIMAINGYQLRDISFNKAQEIFKEALFAKELRLRVLKGTCEPDNKTVNSLLLKEVVPLPQASSSSASSTLTRKTEMAAGTKITTAVHANNTRKIGKLLKITLRKGPLGLGFSITTRDNALGGNTPIYIKNILPKGAAIEDGVLKPGDRLLEVNQVCVDGMSQSDVVTLLRNAPMDSSVDLVVSRHETGVDEQQPKTSPSSAKVVTTAATTQTSGGKGSGKKLHFQMDTDSLENRLEIEKMEEPMDSLEPPNSMPSSSSPPVSSDNYDDMTSEEFQFPWKQREVLTFDIPVHDSERAGLGVSVKGKTSTGKDGVIDLGIFVKSVLHGGAASRDGRLCTNDQLVNINGMSLLGKPNPAAMETLRKAMHEEGPVPGIISLTVARRIDPDLVPHRKDFGTRDSLSSLPTSSDDEIVREYNVSAPAFKMPSSSLANTRNPVIDRLMGKSGGGDVVGSRPNSASLVPSNLRNDSYYIATHQETWNASMLKQHMLPPDNNVLIEQQPSQPDDDKSTVTGGDDHTTTRESLSSLVELTNYPAFARDQPGRQSMSEKRHATLDAKSTDTYQKRKKAREDREREKQKQLWKKSASLESLTVQGPPLTSNNYQRAQSVRVSRNRGCNESFRAAVDRSYEKDFPEDENQDFVVVDDMSDNNENATTKEVVMRRSKSGGGGISDDISRKKNRNSRLLRGLGTMFKIGGQHSSNNTNKAKAAARKSLPASEALTSTSSVGSASSYSKSKSDRDLMQNHPDAASWMHEQHHLQLLQQQQQQYHHARSHSQPRPHHSPHGRPQEYEYFPNAMMRPGSRVGIADPAQLTAPDYDVIQRLQNTHVQPPPLPMQRPPPHNMHYPQYPYIYGGGHLRTGSNLSSGSSSNNNPLAPPAKPPRPKSNFYEYEMYTNNNPASFASSSSGGGGGSHYPSSEQHSSMYSLPRSTSLHQSHQMYQQQQPHHHHHHHH